MNDPLISVDELHQLCRSGDEAPVLIGVVPRWRFWLAHLPGSRQVWRRQLSQPSGTRLIDAAGFTRWAQRQGINQQTPVVLWDHLYDAARVWWAFCHYGQPNVRVLDGGLRAWRAAGLPLERGAPAAASERGSFMARATKAFPIADRALVLASRHQQNTQLWDTRDLAEWQGRRRLRGARRAGRIAWAQHLNWRDFRRAAARDSRFRSEAELQELLRERGVDQHCRQIFYCQAGVRTTTAILALYRLGFDPQQLFNYDGSWREWSQWPDPT